ncbi:MAG: type II toxin-antitoxin system CcdA family antitoxin [Pseudomonadales bacterium]|nr:type II toxin-antitoxin system CcdA family antitoxin [Pseudomonadales bacterium]
MQKLYDKNAPKKPTNLSINSDLLRIAKDLDINISATVEAKLVELVREKAKELWLKENQEAISSYNQHVEENGVFSDEFRSF